MIDAKELRILNIVMMDGEPYQIRAGEQIDDYNDRMKPIPLTPDWLESCGLSFYEQDSELFPMVAMKHNGKVVAVFTKTAPCEYFHQLQNLYHALTGTELQIKL